jgi:hypothetical protein
MTVTSRNPEEVFDFFADVKKSMKVGEAAKSVTKQADGWWTFDHVVAGRSKMKHISAMRDAGVLDHVFVGGGLEWQVYVRIVPNQLGATVAWMFMRPDGLDDEEFERQLGGFDREIVLWRNALEQN